MLDLKSIAVDAAKSVNGHWVKWMGAEFLLARYSNRFAETARAQLHLEWYKKLQQEKISDNEEQEYRRRHAEIIASYVLLDWKNIGEDGKELPYSAEKAVELLTDDSYQDLLDFIIQESTNRDNYLKDAEAQVVAEVKNS
jgi:hypothetical protein